MRKIIASFKEFYNSYQKETKTLLLLSFFLSFFLLSPIINIVLQFKPEISDFSSHIVSNGALHNFDVSKRINLYYSCLLGVILLTGIIFCIILSFFKKRYVSLEENRNDFTLLSNMCIIGITCIFSSFFFINIDLSAFVLVFLCGYLLLKTMNNKPHWNKSNGFWILITAIPFSQLLYRIVQVKAVRTLNLFGYVDDLKLPYSTELLVFFGGFFIICLLLHQFLRWFFSNTTNLELKKQRLYYATIPVSYILIFQSVFLEFFNIINLKTGFVFNSPKLLLAAISLIAILIAVFIYNRIIKTGKVFENDILKKYHFPLLIIAIGFMASQPWRMMAPENEFFEAANHGLAIDHFFRYGSIPIVENFDAHMLSNQLPSYLYGFLNGYEPWAGILYLSYIIVFKFLIVYKILKKIMGSEYALALCLSFPLLGLVNNTYILTGIVGLALIYLINSNSKKKFYWFWGWIIFLCIYKLDVGFSSAVGGVLGYFFITYLLGKSIEIKKFFISAAISFGSVLALFVVLCLFKSVNPVSRLHEFLLVAMSNQNWAVESMGDINNIAYRICYYVLPIFTVALLGKVILKAFLDKEYVSQILKAKHTQAAFVLFIYFAFNFYFNAPRGIVRHSFVSGITLNILSTIPLALLAFIFIKKRKNNLLIFLSSFIGLYLVTNMNKPTFKDSGLSFLSEGLLSSSYNEKFQESGPFNGTRVMQTFSLSEVKHFKSVLDAVLEPDETYFDFSSLNFYYALVGRKNPVYVNQSPLLLNGDKTQEMALEELKNSKVPLVLIPKGENIWKTIDEIPVEYKYYLLAEYIYKNYTPFKSMPTFDIYVLKSKKTALLNKLSKSNMSANRLAANDFSGIALENLGQNQIQVAKTPENKLSLTAAGGDAFLTGLLSQLSGIESFNKLAPVTIKIMIDAKSTGSVQLFYLKENEPNYTEQNSKRYPIENIGKQEISIELTSLPKDLRIDIDLPSIVIEEVLLSNQAAEAVITPEIPSCSLGNIPLIWGEKGDKKFFEKVKPLKEEINQNSFTIDTKKIKNRAQPFYLFFEMNSDTIQTLKLEIFNAKNEKRGDYLLRSKSQLQKMAVRLSANYYWWNDFISKVVLTSERPIKVSKFALVSADGSEQISYEDTGFSLSNINDDYWFNGVGKQSNVLLFNNSQRLLKMLRSSKQLEFIDGSKVTIKNVTEVGTYIHVEIVENLEPYKIAASSPNEVKMIK